MRALLQRVTNANVSVAGREISQIGKGYLVLLGVASGDTDADLDAIAQKILKIRLFPDAEGKMNLSIMEVSGEVLLVSQFTLLAETQKGNRPSFMGAARPEMGKDLYERMIGRLKGLGVKVAHGADMKVGLVNDGPVTIWLDSKDRG
jgi:D-tyrosyl-tRNA(Tyr) deacylase